MTDKEAVASTRKQLSIERKNMHDVFAAREKMLNAKERDIVSWESALERAEVLRKRVASHTATFVTFRSKPQSLHTSLVEQAERDRARLESMTAKERLAECEGEPEIIGNLLDFMTARERLAFMARGRTNPHGLHLIKTSPTEKERCYHELTTEKRIRPTEGEG